MTLEVTKLGKLARLKLVTVSSVYKNEVGRNPVLQGENCQTHSMQMKTKVFRFLPLIATGLLVTF